MYFFVNEDIITDLKKNILKPKLNFFWKPMQTWVFFLLINSLAFSISPPPTGFFFLFDLFGPFLTTLFPTFLPLSTAICLSRPLGLQTLFYLATFMSPQGWPDLVPSAGDCELAHLLLFNQTYSSSLQWLQKSVVHFLRTTTPPAFISLPMASHWIRSRRSVPSPCCSNCFSSGSLPSATCQKPL